MYFCTRSRSTTGLQPTYILSWTLSYDVVCTPIVNEEKKNNWPLISLPMRFV